MTKLKIASWNIAGGHKFDPQNPLVSKNEELQYFINTLKSYNFDVICLQEAHTNNSRSQTKEIALALDFENYKNIIVSESHVDKEYSLSQGIISNLNILDSQEISLPNPSFTRDFPDGRHYYSFDKKIQLVKLNQFSIANLQLLPVHIFNKDYLSTDCQPLVKNIEKIFLNLPEDLIICGDINYIGNLNTLYPNFISQHQLSESLSNSITRHPQNGGGSPDHILFSPKFKLIYSQVVATQSDHFLCLAEFEY